jgi:hypothetical protein
VAIRGPAGLFLEERLAVGAFYIFTGGWIDYEGNCAQDLGARVEAGFLPSDIPGEVSQGLLRSPSLAGRLLQCFSLCSILCAMLHAGIRCLPVSNLAKQAREERWTGSYSVDRPAFS